MDFLGFRYLQKNLKNLDFYNPLRQPWFPAL